MIFNSTDAATATGSIPPTTLQPQEASPPATGESEDIL